MRILGLIPARFASTRFPGKPLVDIAGKSMIRRVYEQALQAEELAALYVATDDERIYQHVEEFGGKAIMTAKHHPSGTDRCAEAMNSLAANFDACINIQGDEPLIDPQQINLLASLIREEKAPLATLVHPMKSLESLIDPNTVKVVIGENAQALYFSRQAIPFQRSVPIEEWLNHHTYYQHIGLYAYEKKALEEITQLPPSNLEQSESLEQLRWLEHGFSILTGITNSSGISIDTPNDLKKLLSFLSKT